jgi:hypothetical protein
MAAIIGLIACVVFFPKLVIFVLLLFMIGLLAHIIGSGFGWWNGKY